jgi:hypothetical protein
MRVGVAIAPQDASSPMKGINALPSFDGWFVNEVTLILRLSCECYVRPIV